MPPDITFTQFLANVGSPIGIAGLFIWWHYKDSRHTQEKLDATQDKIYEIQNGQRTRLEDLNESSIKVVMQSTAAVEKNSDALDRFGDILSGVECVRKDRREKE